MRSKPKILVIDNDTDTIEIVTYVLMEAGYEVVSSTEAKTLKEAQAIRPDLVLLDDWLDKSKDGNLCKELKADKQTRHIPVLLYSVLDTLPDVAKACKADGYIAKPFDVNDLERTIKATLGQ